jgi:hypothetical protein
MRPTKPESARDNSLAATVRAAAQPSSIASGGSRPPHAREKERTFTGTHTKETDSRTNVALHDEE